jgi:hypothetical protein
MGVPRMRLTIGRMMIAVGLSAIVLMAVRGAGRWRTFRMRYEICCEQEEVARHEAEHPTVLYGYCGLAPPPSSTDEQKREDREEAVREALKRADHFATRKRQYAVAMWCPWLPEPPPMAFGLE